MRHFFVWICLVLLVTGCGGKSESGLRYRLKEGESVRYRYYEAMTISAPGTPVPERIELSYLITVRVEAVLDGAVALQVSIGDISAKVQEKGVLREAEKVPAQTAQLQLRPTGEVMSSRGELILPVAGLTLNVLDTFRQALQRYPDPAPGPSAQWPALVHQELASSLSDDYKGTITYAADEERNGVAVARLLVVASGTPKKGPGSVTTRSTAFVSRATGLPVYEEGVTRLEQPGLQMETRSTLTQVR